MIELFRLAAEIQDFCQRQDWPFLITLKSFANRPRDWVDVEGIIARQRSTLDWHCIERSLSPLVEAKESPEILDRLRRLRLAIG